MRTLVIGILLIGGASCTSTAGTSTGNPTDGSEDYGDGRKTITFLIAEDTEVTCYEGYVMGDARATAEGLPEATRCEERWLDCSDGRTYYVECEVDTDSLDTLCQCSVDEAQVSTFMASDYCETHASEVLLGCDYSAVIGVVSTSAPPPPGAQLPP